MRPRTSSSVEAVPLYSDSSTLSSSRRRPLIDQCTNEWQKPSEYRETATFESDAEWLNPILNRLKPLWAFMKAPKFQRLLLVSILTLVIATLCWQSFLSRYISESRAAWDYISAEGENKKGNVFGSNRRVQFEDMIHTKTMNPAYLPRSSKASSELARKNRRLIFIGDIHGCLDELQALLAKVKYNSAQDHIVALGDVINKGPDSKGVVDYLMEQNASCVRGNHEDRILLYAKEHFDPSVAEQPARLEGTDLFTETKAARKAREDRELAKALTRKQLDWLRACPVILRIGNISHHGEVVAVHAGLVPGLSLEDQDPMSVMNMRIVNLTTHVPSQKHSREGYVPWAEFWNRYQKLMLPAEWSFSSHKSVKHTTVVYGHDSKKGLQLDTYTKGLDTGCVNGNALTAWVVSDFGKDEIIQVDCQKH